MLQGSLALKEQLPNELLGCSEHRQESVAVATAERERYTCVLPGLTGEESSDNDDIDPGILAPEHLLAPLWEDKCTKLLLGYWSYELCHGQFLRQYHEEKSADGKTKITEYYLGREVAGDNQFTRESKEEGEKEISTQVPTWHFNGYDYPYYEVLMVDGTPCDLRSNEPRTIRIMYICERDAHPVGTFLNIEEVTTCKYEAVVATQQLCQNKAYSIKENPIHTIHCYPEDDSPKRPKILLEHELASTAFSPKTTSKKVTTETKKTGGVEAPPMQESEAKDSVGSLDSSTEAEFVEPFLRGKMCLRGGTGWWQHELCFGQHVKQVHMEPDGSSTVVFLGFWDKEKHKEWYSKAGKRKRSKNHVINLFVGGDTCDVTGEPRQCQVRFKCVQSGRLTQVSLYLEETTTCSYILTVEGKFICPLLDAVDEHGLFFLL